jgi:hypothetical protein
MARAGCRHRSRAIRAGRRVKGVVRTGAARAYISAIPEASWRPGSSESAARSRRRPGDGQGEAGTAARSRAGAPAGHQAELSSTYMHQLRQRAQLPRLGRAEARGAPPSPDDVHPRAELVEAFLPLSGSVDRNYRAAQQVSRVELMQEGAVGTFGECSPNPWR